MCHWLTIFVQTPGANYHSPEGFNFKSLKLKLLELSQLHVTQQQQLQRQYYAGTTDHQVHPQMKCNTYLVHS
jgi:hypothetical protein